MDHLLNDSQIEALKELNAEDDTSFFKELLQMFTEQGVQTLALLEEAITTKDHKAIYACAHRLKGSSGNIGAAFLSFLCKHLEEAAEEGNEQEIHRLSLEIKKTFDLSVSCLNCHL